MRISGLLLLLIAVALLPDTILSNPGTTPNLEEVFIGRCWEFQTIVNPEAYKADKVNCTDLWLAFKGAFAYKTQCNTTSEDYRPFLDMAAHAIEPDTQLFWEHVYPFVNDYSRSRSRHITVADTLIGYVADKIVWCGQEEEPGINYEQCPVYGDCKHGPTEYWVISSVYYAKAASGTVQVMMNGSNDKPFDTNSIFANHELPHLVPEHNVTRMDILVVHNLGGPVKESCGEGSIKTLADKARDQGLVVTCTNNPRSTRSFQCVDNPSAAECNPKPVPKESCVDSLGHRHRPGVLYLLLAGVLAVLLSMKIDITY